MLQCLDSLVSYTMDKDIDLCIAKTYGSIIPQNRNGVVDKAIENKADFLLFIDSDMVFDQDSLVRLLKHDRDVVSGICVCKTPPFKPVAKVMRDDGVYEVREGLGEGRFYSDIDMVGAAFLLIRTSVFDKMTKPYFAMPPYMEGIMGEDVYFCRKAKELGYDICIDTSVSVGHIGEAIYTIDDHIEYLEAKKNGGNGE